MWHVKRNMWQMIYFIFFIPNSFGIGATILTNQEIQCYPSAGFIIYLIWILKAGPGLAMFKTLATGKQDITLNIINWI